MLTNSTDQTIHILYVDDDEDDFVNMRDLLRSIDNWTVIIDWSSKYETALAQLQQNQHDLCLLDYFIGQPNGLDLMIEAISRGCQIPFVILTGANNREVDLESMKHGASFYLDKNKLNYYDLERAIRYSLEHARLTTTLREINSQLEERIDQHTQLLRETNVQLEAEIAEHAKAEAELQTLRAERYSATLDQIAQYPRTALTAQLLGLKSLKESEPEIFGQFVERYSIILETVLEQLVFMVENRTSIQLRELAEQMGGMGLTPRDLVEIHNSAVASKSKSASPEKARAYIEEGRLTILELMGHLASYYRNFVTSRSRRIGFNQSK